MPDPLKRIRDNRTNRQILDSELPDLVTAAFDAGHSWQEIADVLGVSKARVYQIRDGRR